jgi:hypothetical protein
MQQTMERNAQEQGWMARLLAAVADRTLGWLISCEMGMSPQEAQLFYHYSGSPAGKTMMSRSLARIKVGEEK